MSSRVLAGRCAALLLLIVCTPLLVLGADPDRAWRFLPADDIGAPAFHAAHPGWDGRGVVVAILDTGVDAVAPGLLTTSAGQTKLIDVRDFGTEGDWETAEAELDSSGTDAAPVVITPEKPTTADAPAWACWAYPLSLSSGRTAMSGWASPSALLR